MRIGKNSPERNNARGKILYATEGLFLLDGGLRGIVQGALNYGDVSLPCKLKLVGNA